MTCDEAFEVLTSPAGAKCGDLRAHLHHCPRCRDLQEAIAPALAVMDTPPSRAPWEAGGAAQSAAARLNLIHSQRPQPAFGLRRMWTYLGAFMVGVAAAVVVAALYSPRSTAALQTVPAEICLWRTRDASAAVDGTSVNGARSGDVVLTCVNCHLAQSSTGDRSHLIPHTVQNEAF